MPTDPIMPDGTCVNPAAARALGAIKKAGLKPRSYSGRGMYGRTCLAFSLDAHQPMPDRLPGGHSSESLGKGTIVYWSSIPWDAKWATVTD